MGVSATNQTSASPAPVNDSGPPSSAKTPDTRATEHNQEQNVPPLSQSTGSVSPQSGGASLAGSWLYSRNPDDKVDAAQYPADYIEMKLTDEGGKLRGTYKATYLVVDRAISPRVSFLFEGETRSNEFLWRGTGGSEGRIRLTRKSTHSMEINWFATQMGSELGLGSGSATLYRRQGY